MISVEIDQGTINGIVREEIAKRVERAIVTQTLWDLQELSRQVSMSIPFIKEHFFYNEDFPKFRVGTKWLMPAQETHDYVVNWLKCQPRN